MTDKGYGYEITPCTAKDPVTIPGSHGTKGSENKIDFGSSKLGSGGSKTTPSKGDSSWWKKDQEVKYHTFGK